MKSVLIVGLGKVAFSGKSGGDLITHSGVFSQDAFFNLVGGVEISPKVRESFQGALKLPCIADISEGMSVLKPDLVVVSVPTPNHFQALQSILTTSPPTVILCEKPLALNVKEYELITKLAGKSQTKIFVNYMRRSWPSIIDIHNQILEGSYKLPFKGVVWYSKGLKNNGSHFIDLMSFFLGSIKKLKSIGSHAKVGETDCNLDVQITFERGEVTFLGQPTTDLFYNSFELICSDGRLMGLNGGRTIQWQKSAVDPIYDGYKILDDSLAVIQTKFYEHFKYVPTELEKWFTSGKSSLTTFEESFKMEKLLNDEIGQVLNG